MGRPEEARDVLEELQSANPHGAMNIAVLYSCLNDKDNAFAWLQRAYEDHDASLRWLRSNLVIEDLQDDPRWEALLQKVGVSDTHAQRVTEILGNPGS
jgi:Flp pilus assembly protein TadD